MRRKCPERFSRHRLQWKLLVSYPGVHHGTCVTHVPLCMSGRNANPRWRGKRSRHSWRMRNPQFYVSVKRPINEHVRRRLQCNGSINQFMRRRRASAGASMPFNCLSFHQVVISYFRSSHAVIGIPQKDRRDFRLFCSMPGLTLDKCYRKEQHRSHKTLHIVDR